MAELIRTIARKRDPRAFQDVFLTYGPKVKLMMMRQGADARTAEDIAQQTLLAVWRRAHLLAQARGGVAGWVYAIARGLGIGRLRRQVVWQDYAEELAEAPAADSGVSAERALRIEGTLASLPADQLKVVKLSFIDGLSHRDIAARLAWPPGTVKARLRLACRAIRAALEDDHGHPSPS